MDFDDIKPSPGRRQGNRRLRSIQPVLDIADKLIAQGVANQVTVVPLSTDKAGTLWGYARNFMQRSNSKGIDVRFREEYKPRFEQGVRATVRVVGTEEQATTKDLRPSELCLALKLNTCSKCGRSS